MSPFGHEALPLSGRNASSVDVAQTLSALAPDTVPGTALYDAVVASADHLKKNGKLDKKVLLVVTDGEDNESYMYPPSAMQPIRS